MHSKKVSRLYLSSKCQLLRCIPYIQSIFQGFDTTVWPRNPSTDEADVHPQPASNEWVSVLDQSRQFWRYSQCRAKRWMAFGHGEWHCPCANIAWQKATGTWWIFDEHPWAFQVFCEWLSVDPCIQRKKVLISLRTQCRRMVKNNPYVFMYSKTRYRSRLLSALCTFKSWTMLGWPRNALRKTISLKVRWASVLFRKASNIFFTATYK